MRSRNCKYAAPMRFGGRRYCPVTHLSRNPDQNVQTVVFLKPMGCAPGEFVFISEKDPSREVGLFYTLVQYHLQKWARDANSCGCIAYTFWGWYGCSCCSCRTCQTVWCSTFSLPAMFLVLLVAFSSSSNSDVRRCHGAPQLVLLAVNIPVSEACWYTLTKRESTGVWRYGKCSAYN